MDFRLLHQAITHARAEIPRFQERVDFLKRSMKTDGAVNLGNQPQTAPRPGG